MFKSLKVPETTKCLNTYTRQKAMYIILQKGSVRSAKTTSNILAFAMALEESDDILH